MKLFITLCFLSLFPLSGLAQSDTETQRFVFKPECSEPLGNFFNNIIKLAENFEKSEEQANLMLLNYRRLVSDVSNATEFTLSGNGPSHIRRSVIRHNRSIVSEAESHFNKELSRDAVSQIKNGIVYISRECFEPLKD